MSNNYTFTIETVTPLFVGSGAEYVNGFDIVGNFLININDLTRSMADNTDLLKRFNEAIESNTLERFIDHNKITLTTKPLKIPADLGKNNIKKHIAGMHGDLYIPGSSIKGAIRTAIIAYLEQGSKTIDEQYLWDYKFFSPKFADQGLLKNLLGKNPKNNIMRILQVADSAPVKSKQVYKMKVVGSVKADTWYEMIPPGEKLASTVTIDKFLDKQQGGFFMNGLDFKTILDIINLQSANEIGIHLGYENGQRQELNYKLLKNTIEKLSYNEAIMSIGAGSGYIGITGDLIGDNKTEGIRKKYKLAHHRLQFDFPKTRRLVDVDGKLVPPGWVKISFDKLARNNLEVSITPSVRKLKLSSSKQKKNVSTSAYKIGQIVKGVVKKIMPYGAFVDMENGGSGLLHISQIARERVENVEDFLYEGQDLTLKIKEIKDDGKISLSKKDVL